MYRLKVIHVIPIPSIKSLDMSTGKETDLLSKPINMGHHIMAGLEALSLSEVGTNPLSKEVLKGTEVAIGNTKKGGMVAIKRGTAIEVCIHKKRINFCDFFFHYPTGNQLNPHLFVLPRPWPIGRADFSLVCSRSEAWALVGSYQGL